MRRQRAWRQGTKGLASRRALALATSVVVLAVSGCEHDPTVLEEYPLDLVGAPTRDVESLYLTMEDGVRIAVDVHIPVGYPGGGPFPTILELTRYWRNRGGDAPYTLRRAVKRGFVYVVVDERGTGASFGPWPAPLTDRALADAREVIAWIVAQPWSNGLVGATGVSYPGMAAQQMAAAAHPALRAIVPMSDPWDLYQNLAFPGGVFNQGFLRGWSDVVSALDRTDALSVDGSSFQLQPVDDDPGGHLMEEAIQGHVGNLVIFPAVEGITFRDDPFLPGLTLDDISSAFRVEALEASGIAVYQWGSWMDAGSADGVIQAFMSSTGPRRAVIGSWTHDLSGNASAAAGGRYPSIPTLDVQWEEVLNFFDDILRKGKPLQDRILRYFTMGENQWKATSSWPVPGTENLSYYLGADGALTESPPNQPEGENLYEVDFETRSSLDPRWLGPLFTDTWYPDRISRDHELLVYQSAALTEDLEVTGYPVVHLFLSSTQSDGAVFVYLEDVGPTGAVTYVTEGILRALHRKTSPQPDRWTPPVPYHSYRGADAAPLQPGQVAELAFGLQPTSFLFREGHRIRIAIAGHDGASFARIPETGTPELRIQRNTSYPSSIQLPVVRR